MGKIYSLLLILFIFSVIGRSQAIVSTTHTLTSGQIGITFNVKNTTNDTITIVSVSTIFINTNPTIAADLEVWYNPVAINGAPAVPIGAATGWTMAGTKSFIGTDSITPTEVSCLEIKIPKDSTFGFWIGGSSVSNPPIGYMVLGAGVNTFANNGVQILTGTNIGYGGDKTALSFTPRGFIGNVKFITKDSCVGKPIPGVIIGPKSFCISETQCHSLSGASYAQNGLQYNWYSSPSATGPFTFLQNGFNKNSLINTNTYYKCVLTCAHSGQKDSTPVFLDTMRNYFSCYCTSKAASTADTKIDSVSFLNVKTGSDTTLCQDYTSYLALPAPIVKRDMPISFDVKNGSCSNSFFTGYGTIYIDWNRNAIFEPNESIGSFSNLAAAKRVHRILNTTVPLSALDGQTMVRVMYYETAPPTSGCYSSNWGETEDYRIQIVVDSVNLKLLSINNTGGCEDSLDSLSFTVVNIGKTSLNSPVFAYSVDGGAPVIDTFGLISADSTKTFVFKTKFNLSTYGKHVLKVWSINLADSTKSNDTISKIIYNFQTPSDPVVTHDTICNGALYAEMYAKTVAPFSNSWFSDSACTIMLKNGDTFIIPNPGKDTIFYVKSVNKYTTFFGEDSSKNKIYNIGTGNGLVFNVLSSDFKLNTVDVYIDSGVTVGIEIRDPSNNIILSISYTSSVYGLNRVPINANLPIGTGYKMLLNNNSKFVTCTNLYNSFPLSITNGVSITGSTIPGYYLNFYNWNISYTACESNAKQVYTKYLKQVYLPTAPLNNNYYGCLYPGVTLDAKNLGYTYRWSTNDSTRTIIPTVSGTYMVTISNQFGCKIADTTIVSLKPALVINVPKFITGCYGDSIKVSTGLTNKGYSHRWSTLASNPYSFDPTIYPQVSGKYYLSVIQTDSNCGVLDSVTVLVNPKPVVNLGLDTSSCNNKPIQLNAPQKAGYQYLWQDGSANSSSVINSTQKAWVRVTDQNGCKSSDTINVTISTLAKPDLGNDIVSCGNFTLLGVPSLNNVLYEWNNGHIGSYTQASIPGLYVLNIVENGTRCTFSDSVKVTFVQGQSLYLGPDTISCGKSVVLQANPGWKSYVWSNGFNSSSITVNATGTYAVTASNECGTSRDTIKVSFFSPTSVSLPNDTTICKSITISIPPQASTDTIRWSTGDVNKTSITINQPGNYWVSVKNGCGTASDAMNVTWDSVPTADFSPTINGKFVSFQNLSTNGVKYFWDFGDSKNYSTYFNGANFYDSVKQYSVRLTVKNGCGDSVSITKIIVTDSIVIDPNNNNNNSGILMSTIEGLKVFPNPAKTSINVSSSHKPINRVELYARDGKKVLDVSNKTKTSKELQINLESFASGNYILKIISGDSYQFEKIELIK